MPTFVRRTIRRRPRNLWVPKGKDYPGAISLYPTPVILTPENRGEWDTPYQWEVAASFAWLDTPLSRWWSMKPKDGPMRLRHLMNMTSGYTLLEGPGLAWGYNDYGSGLQTDTMKLILGGGGDAIKDYADSAFAALDWQSGGSGFDSSIRDGGGVSIPARDFARYGLLWLNEGDWDGTQIIPAKWFQREFGKRRVQNALPRTAGSDPGGDYLGVGTYGGTNDQAAAGPGLYSYGVWTNGFVAETGDRAWPDAPLDTLIADGHFGIEIMVVIPSLGIVCAALGSWGDTTDVGNPTGAFNLNLKALVDAVTGSSAYGPTFPTSTWATASSDADAGFDTTLLNAFIAAIDNESGSRGILVRNGKQVRDWGTVTTTIDWASAAKTVLVTVLAKAGFDREF